MLQIIDEIGQETNAPEARRELLRHASLIRTESQAGALIEEDRQCVQMKGEALQTTLMAAL